MTSPSVTPVTPASPVASPAPSAAASPAASSAGRSARKRQRSTRLVVASVLLVLAVAAVAAAALSGSWFVATLAAGAAALLGLVATRITHTELAVSRRDAARDRAEQAQAYRVLTEARIAENAAFAETMTEKVGHHEARAVEAAVEVAEVTEKVAAHQSTITRLERRLAEAAAEVVAAHESLEAETARADRLTQDRERLTVRLDDAEDRAAQAIVRVAELEQELDVVLAEWRAGGTASQRRRA